MSDAERVEEERLTAAQLIDIITDPVSTNDHHAARDALLDRIFQALGGERVEPTGAEIDAAAKAIALAERSRGASWTSIARDALRAARRIHDSPEPEPVEDYCLNCCRPNCVCADPDPPTQGEDRLEATEEGDYTLVDLLDLLAEEARDKVRNGRRWDWNTANRYHGVMTCAARRLRRTSTEPEEGVGACDICGGRRVLIRGKNPGDDEREVCPTCLKERQEWVVEQLTPNPPRQGANDASE